MDAKEHQKSSYDDKPSKEVVEKENLTNTIKPTALENADFTGAAEKTDPVEIALVHKIDWRLMVIIADSERIILKTLTRNSLLCVLCISSITLTGMRSRKLG